MARPVASRSAAPVISARLLPLWAAIAGPAVEASVARLSAPAATKPPTRLVVNMGFSPRLGDMDECGSRWARTQVRSPRLGSPPELLRSAAADRMMRSLGGPRWSALRLRVMEALRSLNETLAPSSRSTAGRPRCSWPCSAAGPWTLSTPSAIPAPSTPGRPPPSAPDLRHDGRRRRLPTPAPAAAVRSVSEPAAGPGQHRRGTRRCGRSRSSPLGWPGCQRPSGLPRTCPPRPRSGSQRRCRLRVQPG